MCFSAIKVIKFKQTNELHESGHGDDGSCDLRAGEFVTSDKD